MSKNHPARFRQNATGPILVSHFLIRLHSSADRPDHNYCAKPAGSDLVLADCEVMAKRTRSRSKPVCKNHRVCWPMLPNRSRLDTNRIRHVYWVGLQKIGRGVGRKEWGGGEKEWGGGRSGGGGGGKVAGGGGEEGRIPAVGEVCKAVL